MNLRVRHFMCSPVVDHQAPDTLTHEVTILAGEFWVRNVLPGILTRQKRIPVTIVFLNKLFQVAVLFHVLFERHAVPATTTIAIVVHAGQGEPSPPKSRARYVVLVYRAYDLELYCFVHTINQTLGR